MAIRYRIRIALVSNNTEPDTQSVANNSLFNAIYI